MVVDYLAFVDLVYVPLSLIDIHVNCVRSKCLRVSKSWNEYLTSMSHLWTNLDLSASKRPVRVSSIKACLRRSKGEITRATLNGIVSLQGGALKLITANCKDLRYLEIRQGFVSASLLEAAPLAHRLDTLILSNQCEVTIDTVVSLLNICRSLSRAEFHTISEVVRNVAQWPLELDSLKQLRLGSYTPHIYSSYRSAVFLVSYPSKGIGLVADNQVHSPWNPWSFGPLTSPVSPYKAGVLDIEWTDLLTQNSLNWSTSIYRETPWFYFRFCRPAFVL